MIDLSGEPRHPIGTLGEPEDPLGAHSEQFVIPTRAQQSDLAASEIGKLIGDQPGYEISVEVSIR
jgi:hypothetical protein